MKKLLSGLLLHEIRLEIMLDDHLVQNRALLDYRKGLFGQVAILEFFQMGEKISLEIIFENYLVRKQALLDYKKGDFIKCSYWIFFKGVNP